jgi:hypothetical protein
LDGIPHLLLAAVIAFKGRVLGVLAISPCLHPTELRLGLIGTDGINQHGEPRLERGTDTTVVASLLEGDIIVLTVTERLTKRDRVFDDTTLPNGRLRI